VKRRKRRRQTVEEFALSGPLAHALVLAPSLRAARALERLGLAKLKTVQRDQRLEDIAEGDVG
jgi:hypothetical protein